MFTSHVNITSRVLWCNSSQGNDCFENWTFVFLMSSFQNIVLNKRLTLIQHICQDPRPVQGRNDPMEILTINIEPGASGNNEQGEPAATYR